MKTVLVSVVAAAILCGCTTDASRQPPLATASNTGECLLPDGWDEVSARDPRFVVFGETHGTREGPEFFGSVACGLAMSGERILVAVEHSANHDDAFQAAWQLDEARFAPTLLAAGWKGREDGVASEAMLVMIERLHALKEAGRAIDIVAFNGARDEAQKARFSHLPAQGPHEAAQAENIVQAAMRSEYDRVLVLVGGLHARDEPVDMGRGEFLPMVGVLRDSGTVVSLDMRHAGGTAWNCILAPGVEPQPGKPVTQEMIECASHPLGGAQDEGMRRYVALPAAPPKGYDGVFYVGTVSGSPPALPGD